VVQVDGWVQLLVEAARLVKREAVPLFLSEFLLLRRVLMGGLRSLLADFALDLLRVVLLKLLAILPWRKLLLIDVLRLEGDIREDLVDDAVVIHGFGRQTRLVA